MTKGLQIKVDTLWEFTRHKPPGPISDSMSKALVGSLRKFTLGEKDKSVPRG
jgi:hypothetical protein